MSGLVKIQVFRQLSSTFFPLEYLKLNKLRYFRYIFSSDDYDDKNIEGKQNFRDVHFEIVAWGRG